MSATALAHLVHEATAAVVVGAARGGGSGGDPANLRWVGVAFLGAAAVCFAGFAVLSLRDPEALRARQRQVLGILAAVFFLVGVGLGVAGVVAA